MFIAFLFELKDIPLERASQRLRGEFLRKGVKKVIWLGRIDLLSQLSLLIPLLEEVALPRLWHFSLAILISPPCSALLQSHRNYSGGLLFLVSVLKVLRAQCISS